VGSTDSDSTWSSVDTSEMVNEDWAAENAQVMRGVYFGGGGVQAGRALEQSNTTTTNRLNSRPGRGSCLAGQAAGWTYESVATKQCCSGYSFSALTASEAYINYGIPIGDIVAGVASIGMCLKNRKTG